MTLVQSMARDACALSLSLSFEGPLMYLIKRLSIFYLVANAQVFFFFFFFFFFGFDE
jgi:hypothetical protein